MKKIISGIYKITSPKGRIYIGQSIDINERWVSYYSLNCKRQRLLYRSLKKHGPGNHTFEIMEECTEEVLNDREVYYIKLFDSFNTPHGLNLTPGGESCKKSEDHKNRISESHKGWWKHNYREKSEEQIRKYIETMKEYWKNASKEERFKRGNSNRGTTLTEERKKQIGEYSKMWWQNNTVICSEETRKKRSEGSKLNWQKNRDNIIASQTGIKRTEEQKKNYSEGAKKRWKENPVIYTEEIRKKKSESVKGDKNPMYGRKQSEESKKKNSDSQKANYERIKQERLMMIF